MTSRWSQTRTPFTTTCIGTGTSSKWPAGLTRAATFSGSWIIPPRQGKGGSRLDRRTLRPSGTQGQHPGEVASRDQTTRAAAGHSSRSVLRGAAAERSVRSEGHLEKVDSAKSVAGDHAFAVVLDRESGE